MTKVGRQRFGRILQKAGFILVLAGLAVYIPYIIFPLALAIIIAGIFWKRFSQSHFWRWLTGLCFIKWLFILEKDSGNKNGDSTSEDDYQCPSRNQEVKYKPSSNNTKTDGKNISHVHNTPPKRKL